MIHEASGRGPDCPDCRNSRELARGSQNPTETELGLVERSLVGTVLLVDDEESVRATVEACLEAIGVGEVRVAESGEMALAMVAAQKPAVLLLDLLMPGTDGFAVLRALRGLQPNQQPDHIIVMSAMADPSVVDALVSLGADAVLPKPFNLSELRCVLDRYGQARPDAHRPAQAPL